jgi:hypothetical protein
VVCSIFKFDGAEPEPMKKWFSEHDARKLECILGEMIEFIEQNDAKSVGMIDQIIGCHPAYRISPSRGMCVILSV